MQSAVGCAQLERLNEFLDHRQALGKLYDSHLRNLDFVSIKSLVMIA